jgi:hypothetical protein
MGTQYASWQAAMANGRVSVPAHELLDERAPMWQQTGLAPMPVAETASFAAFGRLLQYGQAMTMALPMPSNATFARLLSYAHRLRMDAVDGAIRAGWLQPAKMVDRSDIVVLTRPSARHAALAKIVDLHTATLRIGLPFQPPGKRLRTLLVDGNTTDLMALFKLVEDAARPFLFVVDGTGAGVGEEAGHLQALLQEYFPDVPFVTVLAAGDAQALEKVIAQPSRAHLWRWRQGDEAQAGAVDGKRAPRMTLAKVEDAIANTHLATAAAALRTLSLTAASETPSVRQKIVAPLYKVFTSLRTLALPLEWLEKELLDATHGGRFPVMMLKRWIDSAREAECRYADTRAAVTAAAKALDAAYAVMDGDTTGKAQAVLARVKAAATERRVLTVLVGGKIEAQAVKRWLDHMLDLEDLPDIRVLPMDGVRALTKTPANGGEVLVLGILWPNRMPWLRLPCEEALLPAYPFEADMLRRQLTRWWEQCGRPSRADGDKLRLWQLDWPRQERCLDDQTDPQAVNPLVDASWPFAGSYRRAAKVLTIPVVDRYSDWIDVLLAEHERSLDDEDGEPDEREGGSVAWLRVTGYAQPIAWPSNKVVLVLEKDDIKPRLPQALEPGNRIVLLRYNDERVATQAALFQMFCSESDGMDEITRFADKWQTLVGEVFKRFDTVTAVRSLLARHGISVTTQTIYTWRRGERLGPENPKVIETFAAECGHKTPEKHARKIHNALEAIRTEHRRIGRDLNAALLEHTTGADEVRIGSLKLDAAAFSAMVDVCEIEDVTLPAAEKATAVPALLDVAAKLGQRYPGRLLFTPTAERSLKHCAFKDIDRFDSCLELMATKLWPMYYSGEGRMHDLLRDFEAKSISFAGGTAATTQGRSSDYQRTYKGKPVDIGRHFKLGTAWDPTLTMRVHFHWDEEGRQIVIHHAGEHLKTTIS